MNEPTPWQQLAEALDRGEIEGIRNAVRDLDDEGETILAERLGGNQVEHVRRAARRGRESKRRASGGRVVVVHGIMGARLEVVRSNGEANRVWVDYWQLFNGHIADLELNAAGGPNDPGLLVRVAGIFPEYLPLLLELDTQWQVTPFAFDWRRDIDGSADRLAQEIRLFARGEPCHIIAHSMGGLVSRRMIAKHPDVWASMLDADGMRRGGRLIQLGTPNRGSFSIPMVMTGKEPIVRHLGRLDRKHKLDAILPILATFPGSYQMMPLPGSGPDERDRLYDLATWGKAPAIGKLLERGRQFQQGLVPVIDPERIVYVAGYDQETPYRIRVKDPGQFEYQVTRNGDGRVPHELGLLDGVRTLWLKEEHGALPQNKALLSGVHALLETGNTVELEQTMPASRARASAHWIAELPDDDATTKIDALVGVEAQARAAKPRQLSEAQAQQLEALVVRGWVGSDVPDTASVRSGSAARKAKESAKRLASPIRLNIEVICGDITKVDGDVYAVGHYVGVLPHHAEGALDRVISAPDAEREERVLRSLTRRGVLRGELGEIALYPWADGSGRHVAVAGMGHPGGFGRTELRLLASNLTVALTALPGVKTVCTVLIGSGTGNLAVADAVEGMILGAADALRREGSRSDITTLRFVELDLVKANTIHSAVQRIAADDAVQRVLALHVRRMSIHASGRTAESASLSTALAGLAAASRAETRGRRRNAVAAVLESLPGGAKARAAIARHLSALASDREDLDQLAARLEIVVHDRPTRGRRGRREADIAPSSTPPTRYSCVRDRDHLQVAALAESAVVPLRVLRFDLSLFDELVEKATDPEDERSRGLGALIGQLLVPQDFTAHVRYADAIVAELDRYTARLSWEMMSLDEQTNGDAAPLATRVPFARQLRTAYSPAPSVAAAPGTRLRVLVIGDPGDPNEGDDLPGARREAIEVATLLSKKKGVDVDALIGAPSAPRQGELRDYAPAGRLDVIGRLLSGDYQLVHYCGHGDFDPDHADKVGWVFEGGLLTAHEVERIARAPRLIVANACLSGRTSAKLASGQLVWRRGDETGLLPSLADEFFMRGVRDYIGTAWEVSDEGAILFATTFYEKLLADAPATIGEALLAARVALFEQRKKYDALWAAYQHYGDAQQRIARPRGARE